MIPFALRRLRGKCRKTVYPLLCRSQSEFVRVPELDLTSPTFGQWDSTELVLWAFREAPLGAIDKLWADHILWGGKMEGYYDYFDMVVLWGIITRFGVKRVVECSPLKGWSTASIQLALNGQDTHHISFDICDYEKQIRHSVETHTSLRDWQFVLGDFTETAYQHLDFISTADLVFIDSNHREAFARWYLDEFQVFQKIKEDALVHIHDIYPIGRQPTWSTESPYVVDWLRARKDDFQVFWTYELSRFPYILERLPRGVFYHHSGRQASDCSIWIRRREGQPR